MRSRGFPMMMPAAPLIYPAQKSADMSKEMKVVFQVIIVSGQQSTAEAIHAAPMAQEPAARWAQISRMLLKVCAWLRARQERAEVDVIYVREWCKLKKSCCNPTTPSHSGVSLGDLEAMHGWKSPGSCIGGKS